MAPVGHFVSLRAPRRRLLAAPKLGLPPQTPKNRFGFSTRRRGRRLFPQSSAIRGGYFAPESLL